MSTKKSLSQSRLFWRYQIELFVSLAVYIVLLLVSIHELKRGVSGAGRVLWAISPMLPAAFMVGFIIRYVRRMDELQRRIQTESLAIAAGVTALLGLTYGFLEGSAGFPHIEAWWAWASVGFTWGIAGIVLRRRYR